MIKNYSIEQLNYLNAKTHLDTVKAQCEVAYAAEIPGYANTQEAVDSLSYDELEAELAAIDAIDKRYNLHDACVAESSSSTALIAWGIEQAERTNDVVFLTLRMMVPSGEENRFIPAILAMDVE